MKVTSKLTSTFSYFFLKNIFVSNPDNRFDTKILVMSKVKPSPICHLINKGLAFYWGKFWRQTVKILQQFYENTSFSDSSKTQNLNPTKEIHLKTRFFGIRLSLVTDYACDIISFLILFAKSLKWMSKFEYTCNSSLWLVWRGNNPELN